MAAMVFPRISVVPELMTPELEPMSVLMAQSSKHIPSTAQTGRVS